ncbi:MAG: PepSY domain-containing protein [Thermomicrobiales bacterium]
MQTRGRWIVALVLGAGVLGSGIIGASASTGPVRTHAHPSSLVESARDGAASLARLIGVSDDDDDTVAPGTIDDGKELLPRAGISLERAIAAAQSAVSGPIGEVDVEYFDGRLVFNVDVGEFDVKVDAATGEVLAADQDD